MTPSGYFLEHLWLIPLFPLVTAALMLLIGRRLPRSAVSFFCVGSVFLSFVHAAGAVFQLLAVAPENRVYQQILFEWITPERCPDPAAWSTSWPIGLSPRSALLRDGAWW